MTLDELRNEGMLKLKEAGIADAALDASLLLQFVLDAGRDYILSHGRDEADEDKALRYRELTALRCTHVPLQHITGHQEFMGLDFTVNEHVLIPRQDTECLVEEAMIETEDGMRVLDLCTGSGCILISLMKYKNDIEGIGTDISGDALEVARHNADINGAYPVFLKGDLYGALDSCKGEGAQAGKSSDRFDVIISNPPYIRKDVIPTLMEEVKDHEPQAALDGGEDGLDFYRRIIEGADEWLVPGGCILFEIGYDQAREVTALLEERGYGNVETIKDLAGLDRVVKGRRKI